MKHLTRLQESIVQSIRSNGYSISQKKEDKLEELVEEMAYGQLTASQVREMYAICADVPQRWVQWIKKGSMPNIREKSYDYFATFEAKWPGIEEFIESFVESSLPKQLYIHGNASSGKTFLANYALASFMSSRSQLGETTFYSTFQRLVSTHNTGMYKDDRDLRAAYNRISAVSLLVIDDVDLTRLSESDRDFLRTLMRQRYSDDLSTIIVSRSNVNSKEFAQSIFSPLSQTHHCEMIGIKKR